MKVIYLQSEVINKIAAEHGVSPDCVEIECMPVVCPHTDPKTIAALLMEIAYQVQKYKETGSKLSLIKPIKDLYGLGLKDSKDIADLMVGV